MNRIRAFLAASLLLWVVNAVAGASPATELVVTIPQGVTLPVHGARDPLTVWNEMIDHATREIDFGEFYISGEPGQRGAALDSVIAHLQRAAQRGVKIQFLMEAKGVRFSDDATIARVKAIPNLTFRMLDYNRMTGGGIIHAKYFLVDRREGFVGSQNFDWRSLTQIHETGIHTMDPHLVAQLSDIFDVDWRAADLIAHGLPVPNEHAAAEPGYVRDATLVASPAAYDPGSVADSQATLVNLLAHAQREVRIAVMDYAPLAYVEHGPRDYYSVIDDAIRAAATRGVKVSLMVADWNTGAPSIAYLKSLALVPNVEIKVVSFPQLADGFIPYARVLHSKFMEIDGQVAWVGTSNWTGGYLDKSRNIEAVLRDPAFATQLASLHDDLWNSNYASPLDIAKSYPTPHPGRP